MTKSREVQETFKTMEGQIVYKTKDDRLIKSTSTAKIMINGVKEPEEKILLEIEVR